MILLVSPQNKYATRRFAEEAGKAGMAMEIMDVQALAERDFKIDVEKYDCLFIRQANPYFDQLINLAKRLSEVGKFVVDREFITGGFETSKAAMYERLEKAGLEIPETHRLFDNTTPPHMTGHPSYIRRGGSAEILGRLAELSSWNRRSTLAQRGGGGRNMGLFPFILKWIYGFGGKHTYFIRNENDYQSVISLHPADEWLAQEYIEADCEYEVYVVGGKAVGPILKFAINRDGFKADLAHYELVSSSANQSTPTAASGLISKTAEAADKAVGYELAKVDILEKDKRLYILEVNRTPSFIPFEQFSGYNMAGECIKYISKQLTIDD